MSTLVYSLLTLAALLAASDAQKSCKTVLFGNRGTYDKKMQPVKLPPVGVKINETHDECIKQKKGLTVGALVRACNAQLNGAAPDIRREDRSYVVTCPFGCPLGGTVFVMYYCELDI
ncbi:uncharacterized protein LOC133533808 [Cydia pomonella]|uniref:uncharacterized protein LOC133518343 n=1 Tax=Cydia pomonella TaxID=82600 RepID=UPI002ADDE390|nr:uncharacterized protein LOC133518343 [Cydia pomonella]XP_061728841.1 uncharacterized protein LOC133533808 [Cydia pomonella]